MLKNKSCSFPMAAACLLALAFPALAHDIKLVADGDGYILAYGHGDKWEGYKTAQVKSAIGYDTDGKPSAITVEKRELQFAGVPGGMLSDDAARIKPADAGMVTVLFDDGYWTKTSDGWANQSKKHFKQHEESSQYWMYTKTLFKWSASYAKPVGLDLEIVPLANPWDKDLKSLPIQLLYQGKPLANTDVEIEGNTDLFTTDAQGKTNIPLHASGINYIGTSHKQVLTNDPDRDEFEITTNLRFTR